MTVLEKLKNLIDEANYPYFSDAELQARIDEQGEGIDLNSLAYELCLVKAGIEEIKLGDVLIPSPRKHFLSLTSRYRSSRTGVVTRADRC